MDGGSSGGGGGGLVSSVLGGILGNNGANNAQEAQQRAQEAAIAEQRRQYDLSRGDQMPFMQFGQSQLGGLSALAGGDYSGFMNSPDFKARVNFANEQFNNGAAAKFRLFSGGAQNDRDALNQGLAAQGLGDYRQSLQWGAGLGQNAASGLGALGAQAANQIGNSYGNIGQAGAQGAYDRANNWGNTLNGINQAFSSAYGGFR